MSRIMKKHKTISRLIFFLWLMSMIGCSHFQELNLLTDEDEVSMGKQFAEEIEQEVAIYEDAAVTAYIDRLGQTLARRSQRNDIEYHFKVVDSDDVNAFALPGGYLYINRGLISTAQNESELAGVLAHEIGHVVGRHGAKSLSRQMPLTLLAQLFLGENPTLLRQIVAGILGAAAQIKMLEYGREAELEADAYSVQNLYDAEIDPNGMSLFFEQLLTLEKREPSRLEQWLSTHPPTKERLQQTEDLIRKLPSKPNLKKDSPEFHTIQRRLPEPKQEAGKQ